MKKFIHHIRNKPEQTRKHILHVTTLVCAVILLALWVYSLSVNFTNPDTQREVKQGFKPFTVIKNDILSLW